MKTRSQWGIGRDLVADEEDRLASVNVSDRQASDHATERKTLLYGPRGQELLVQAPRPVGFRKP
jgi:hypothetical protein